MSTTGWARSTGRDGVPGGAVIWTPDQRLRVFVSSTLRELAAERQAVRDAVTSSLLAPVMFELGTRPHPVPLSERFEAGPTARTEPRREGGR
jgi:Domain of unknown function (DUF4062)